MEDKSIKVSFQNDIRKVTRKVLVDSGHDIDNELMSLGRLIKKNCHIIEQKNR